MRRSVFLVMTLMLAAPVIAQTSRPTESSSADTDAAAKSTAPLPEAPKQKPDPEGAYNYLYRGTLACGGGAAYTQPNTRPLAACGFGIVFFPYVVTEFGVMGAVDNQQGFTGYWSEDFVGPIPIPKSAVHKVRGHPIGLAGYTRMFETGRNALDYGLGFERHVDDTHSLQFELRDYWTFADTRQHNVMLRVVWLTGLPD